MLDDYLVKAGLAKARGPSTEFLARRQRSFNDVTEPYGDYIQDVWNDAKRLGIGTGPQSGPLFEMLIGSVFIAADVAPFFRRAELANARKIECDFLFWESSSEVPICIELTSTLRERYKLADLQAFKIKANYPNGKFFQLTMDYKDASRRSNKDFESLDGLVFAGSPQFESVISAIRKLKLSADAPLEPNKNTTLHFGSNTGATFQSVFSE